MEQLIDYIAADNPSAAATEARKVMEAIRQLAEHPASGRTGRVFGTRELVLPPYIIAYRVKGEAVQILRILHSARRFPNKLP